MSSSRRLDSVYVDPGPFRRWADTWIERHAPNGRDELGAEAGSRTAQDLANALGISGRVLYRWRKKQDQLPRDELEHALMEAGTPFWELYGIEEIDLEADAYCERCHENVSPIEGHCPWCDGEVGERRARGWCEREDRLMYPSTAGTCWRCGDALQQIPWRECGCGCGTQIPAFDPQGRRSKLARGHNPREHGEVMVPTGPFVEHLRAELDRIDVVGALAREHRLRREEVVALLKGQIDELPIAVIRDALWTGRRSGGGGKGSPNRIDRPTLRELYPGYVRSKVCPECGKGKAPHAKLCKSCRNAQNKREGKGPPKSPTKIREELILSAHRRYWEDGLSIASAAQEIFSETGHTNVGSTKQALSAEWKKRDLPMRARANPKAAAAAASP